MTYKKSGNEYKLLPYKLGPKKLCDFTKDEKMFYPDIIKYTNFPPIPSCDFKPGTYTVDNYLPDMSAVPPVIDSGDYSLEVKVFQDGTDEENFVNGYRLYASVLHFGGPVAPVG